jgi:hypothetical protein
LTSIFAQITHGVPPYTYIVAPLLETPLRAHCIRQFCSACKPRHNSCRSPEGTLLNSRMQKGQCGKPAGAPLYPVARIRRSRTRTAPTFRLRQVERSATSAAISVKYSSQLFRVRRRTGGVSEMPSSSSKMAMSLGRSIL